VASPSRRASSGPAPTPLSDASSPSRAHVLSPALSPAAAAPSRGDLSPALGLGCALEGRVRVHAPTEVKEKEN